MNYLLGSYPVDWDSTNQSDHKNDIGYYDELAQYSRKYVKAECRIVDDWSDMHMDLSCLLRL